MSVSEVPYSSLILNYSLLLVGNIHKVFFFLFIFILKRTNHKEKKKIVNLTGLQTLVTFYFTPLIKTKWTLPAFPPVRIKVFRELGEMLRTLTSKVALLLYMSFPTKTCFIKTPKFPQFFDGCFLSMQYHLSVSYISYVQYWVCHGKHTVHVASMNK